MAQQNIAVGSAANDGTGDPLRTAWQKVQANFTDLYSGKLDASAVGAAAAKNTGVSAGNVPVLDGNGLLDVAVLPAIAITDTFVVASQAVMLALTAQKGDLAVRTDLNKSFVLSTNSPSTLADWKELLTPTDAVLSVAALTGAISAAALRTALSVLTSTAYAAYSPAASAQTPGGTPPTLTVNSARWSQNGKVVTAHLAVTVTAAGTGSGGLIFNLPVAANGSGGYGNAFGREASVNGLGLVGSILNTGNGFLNLNTGATPLVTGYRLEFTAIYEAA